MDQLSNKLFSKLKEREKNNSLRKLHLPNENLIDFYSNDYLGLGKKDISIKGKSGSTGSRLLGGNSKIHEDFEKYLAKFHYADSALLFNSGYAANIGLFSCLLERGDTFIYDELCHASIRDGLRLSHATSWSFSHNDLSDLEKKINQAKGKIIVITESVFSMDGHFAPLKEIVQLKMKFDFDLVVDEAHAVGVFGKEGRGLVSEYNLEKEVFARIITFGKAIGAHGAAIVGKEILRNYLINFSRSFIYTTALPENAIFHLENQYKKMVYANEERIRLKQLIHFYVEQLNEFPSLKSKSLISNSAIQSILFPGNNNVKSVAEILNNNGFDIRPILSPTVPEGKERLRICLHEYNSKEEIIQVMSVLSAQI